MAQLAEETIKGMKSALDDDLNTAEAQARIFDMLRRRTRRSTPGKCDKTM